MKVKSKNVLKVIRNFEKAMELYPQGMLNMASTRVNVEHTCGTVHCHAGWYAIGASVAVRENRALMIYTGGAIMMAEDLEILNRDLPVYNNYRSDFMPPLGYTSVPMWAEKNPELWGNVQGTHMFGYRSAFWSEKRPLGALSLQDIIDHWKEVYERIKAQEEAERATEYLDITKELAILPQEEVPDSQVKQLT